MVVEEVHEIKQKEAETQLLSEKLKMARTKVDKNQAKRLVESDQERVGRDLAASREEFHTLSEMLEQRQSEQE